MTYVRSGTSTGGGKTYNSVVYKCTADDSWTTEETPKDQEGKE